MRSTIAPEKALGAIPDGLRTPLLDEFNKLARHYRESRWEPAELNGGKLCEIVYTILKGHIDGTFPATPSKPPNMLDACKAQRMQAVSRAQFAFKFPEYSPRFTRFETIETLATSAPTSTQITWTPPLFLAWLGG